MRSSFFALAVLLLLLLFDPTTIDTGQIPLSVCFGPDHWMDSVDSLTFAPHMVLEPVLGGFLRW